MARVSTSVIFHKTLRRWFLLVLDAETFIDDAPMPHQWRWWFLKRIIQRSRLFVQQRQSVSLWIELQRISPELREIWRLYSCTHFFSGICQTVLKKITCSYYETVFATRKNCYRQTENGFISLPLFYPFRLHEPSVSFSLSFLALISSPSHCV